MRNITIAGNKLSINEPQERLGMGGPYTGRVIINDKIILDDLVLENFVYQEESRLLFVVKYHQTGNYAYFTINFYNFNTGQFSEFDKEFKMVYIKQFISPTVLEIFNAFHDQSPHLRSQFALDDENFSVIV